MFAKFVVNKLANKLVEVALVSVEFKTSKFCPEMLVEFRVSEVRRPKLGLSLKVNLTLPAVSVASVRLVDEAMNL
jgi:hypothetical protein